MGVSHLMRDQRSAAKMRVPGSNYDSANMPGGTRPTTAAKPMPGDGKVSGYSHVALKAAGKKAAQMPKDGAHVGLKTSQPKLGGKMGGVLGKAHPNGNGGRAG